MSMDKLWKEVFECYCVLLDVHKWYYLMHLTAVSGTGPSLYCIHAVLISSCVQWPILNVFFERKVT